MNTIHWHTFVTRAPSQYKDGLFRYRPVIIKMRWSWDRLIFIVGIPILVRLHIYIETGPRPLGTERISLDHKLYNIFVAKYLSKSAIWSRLCLKDMDITFRSPLENWDRNIDKLHFPRYWPFVWGIHRSSLNSPHKGQWRGALIFSLICAWINGWVNNREAGDFRRNRTHYDVNVMWVIGMKHFIGPQESWH